MRSGSVGVSSAYVPRMSVSSRCDSPSSNETGAGPQPRLSPSVIARKACASSASAAPPKAAAHSACRAAPLACWRSDCSAFARRCSASAAAERGSGSRLRERSSLPQPNEGSRRGSVAAAASQSVAAPRRMAAHSRSDAPVTPCTKRSYARKSGASAQHVALHQRSVCSPSRKTPARKSRSIAGSANVSEHGSCSAFLFSSLPSSVSASKSSVSCFLSSGRGRSLSDDGRRVGILGGSSACAAPVPLPLPPRLPLSPPPVPGAVGVPASTTPMTPMRAATVCMSAIAPLDTWRLITGRVASGLEMGPAPASHTASTELELNMRPGDGGTSAAAVANVAAFDELGMRRTAGVGGGGVVP